MRKVSVAIVVLVFGFGHGSAEADIFSKIVKKGKKYVKKEVVGAVTGKRPPRIGPHISINSNGRQIFHTNGQKASFKPGPFSIKTTNLPKRTGQVAGVMSGDPRVIGMVATEQVGKALARQQHMQQVQMQQARMRQMQIQQAQMQQARMQQIQQAQMQQIRMQQMQQRIMPAPGYRPHPGYGYPAPVYGQPYRPYGR